MAPAEPRPHATPSTESDRVRAAWEREMRRARVTARLLGALLLALVVVILTGRVTVLLGLSAVAAAALFLAAIGLIRRGRRVEPEPRSQSSSS